MASPASPLQLLGSLGASSNLSNTIQAGGRVVRAPPSSFSRSTSVVSETSVPSLSRVLGLWVTLGAIEGGLTKAPPSSTSAAGGSRGGFQFLSLKRYTALLGPDIGESSLQLTGLQINIRSWYCQMRPISE
jgi:hypothetical protein